MIKLFLKETLPILAFDSWNILSQNLDTRLCALAFYKSLSLTTTGFSSNTNLQKWYEIVGLMFYGKFYTGFNVINMVMKVINFLYSNARG